VVELRYTLILSALVRVCALCVCSGIQVEHSLYGHNDKVHTAFDKVGELLHSMHELAEDEAEAARSCVAKAQQVLDEREAAARRTAERHQKMLKRIGGQRR
jgi:ElaB/YqjD/DUF883 family membrane-anchored ribosome-binding protein